MTAGQSALHSARPLSAVHASSMAATQRLRRAHALRASQAAEQKATDTDIPSSKPLSEPTTLGMPSRRARASLGGRVHRGLLSFCTRQSHASVPSLFITGSTGSAPSLLSFLASSSAFSCFSLVAASSSTCGACMQRRLLGALPSSRCGARRLPKRSTVCSTRVEVQCTPQCMQPPNKCCISCATCKGWAQHAHRPMPDQPQWRTRLLVLRLAGPELDGELDELAVLLDQAAQLARVGQLGCVLLEVQRDACAALEVARLVLPHLHARTRTAGVREQGQKDTACREYRRQRRALHHCMTSAHVTPRHAHA